MSRPMFTPGDVNEIRNSENSEFVRDHGNDYLIRIIRPVPGLNLKVGDSVLWRPQADVPDGQVALVTRDREQLVRRAPVGGGTIIGLVLGRLEEITDAD